jgi:TonB-dependent SusC/RagA subfamily outer membrane receptor
MKQLAPTFNSTKHQRKTYSTNTMPARCSFKKLFLLAGLLFCCTLTFGQGYQQITNRIDSLNKLGLPKSALEEVDKLEKLARDNKNAPQQIKAVIYRMAFQSYVEENAIVGIITRLKLDADQAVYPVKPVLQSLLASMYWTYYQRNRYQFGQRSHLENPGNDITKWDLQTISTQASHLYRLSLQDYQKEQDTPISILDGVLYGDKTTRYLRPTLYDMLVHRALDFLLAEEPALVKPKLPFTLNDPRLFSDSRTFANLQITTTDTASTFYYGIKYLQQATLFHLQKPNDGDALADVDLQRLEFLNRTASVTNKDQLYLNALGRIAAQFSELPVAADALVLQGKYYQGKDSLKQAAVYFNKAYAGYPDSFGARNAESCLKVIQQKELSATVEGVNVPGKPLLGFLNYHNIKTARLIIYKISATQYNELARIPSDINRFMDGTTIYASDAALKYLAKLQPVQNTELKLPDPQDYHRHTTEFKIDPLQSGHYVLVIRDGLSDAAETTQLAAFKVCNLSFVNRRTAENEVEIRVVNRETGAPVPGVHVTVAETHDNITNANGACWFDLNNVSFSVKLTTGIDTLYVPARYVYSQVPINRVNTSTILFTDRNIYRPGQTIYYKGLHIQINEGKSTILPNQNVSVDIKDNSQKLLSSTQAVTNEFGTFSGSFAIPQNVLNGYVTIQTGDGSKYIRVEEYKRPSFEVAFLPVTGNYKPNDSVTVKGTVTAYSGYGLSQARVAFHVSGQPQLKNYRFYAKYGQLLSKPSVTINDTIKTDDQGNFTIKFKATASAGIDLNDANYRYTITADITDASGETRSANTSLLVGSNNFTMYAYLGDKISPRDSILVRVTNLNNKMQSANLQLKVYALTQHNQLFKARLWGRPDQLLMGRSEFEKNFPDYAYANEDNESTWAVKSQVVDVSLKSDAKRLPVFKLDILSKQPTGVYKIVINAKNDRGDTCSTTHYVYLMNEPGRPQKFDDWVIPQVTHVKAGASASFLVGTGKPAHVLMEKYSGTQILSSQWLNISGGKQQLIKVPVNADENNVSVQFLTVYQNRMYSSYQDIVNKEKDERLNIRFLTFRNQLQPGEKEEWKLQISGKNNEQQAAEMVADLYDASLDNIGGYDSWNGILNRGYVYTPHYFGWDNNFVNQIMTNPLKYNYYGSSQITRFYETLNMFGYNYYGGYNAGFLKARQMQTQRLNGQKEIKGDPNEGIRIDEPVGNSALNEVMITGYGMQAKRDLTGSVASVYSNQALTIDQALEGRVAGVNIGYGASTQVTIRGASSLGSGNVPLYVIDGIIGEVTDLNPDDIESINVLKDAQATNLYGARGANGVIVITTKKGRKALLGQQPIETRKNFNETAFFYPQLHTNEKGEILIEFTIPEALSKWRFKAFAHTKDLKTGYIESEIVTQKQLSISANMPRFLREGDTITVSARLANLTTTALKGKVNLQLFNALNMQPVSLLLNPADAEQSFDVAAATNKAMSFRIVIPAGLDALDYRLTADAGQFTDGEENTLPVLPNRMLVTESMPMMVRPGQERAFTFDKLIHQNSATLKNKTLTLEYTQNPAWYAVQALPYMMEFPYECSEQVFSRYYANSMATNLVNKLPVIKQVFEQWKAGSSPELLSNLEKNQELKATLIEETPWLRDAMNETEQKKRIALLFDLDKMSNELQLNLNKLKDKQLSDGGFPWFGGDKSDQYITRHILAGFGQLYHLGIVDLKDQTLKSIADKAMNYVDGILIDDANWEKKQKTYEGRSLGSAEIHAYYAESYYTSRAVPADVQPLLANYLELAASQWRYKGLYEQAMIALTMQRNNKPEVAQMIMKSLLETAQHSDDMGMYWAKNQLGYYWYQSPVETQSLMIELFTEAGNNDKAVEEMKIWLLREKQTNNWKTTTATAAACYALLLKGDNWLADNGTSEIKLDGKLLTDLKPSLKADEGTGYIKTSWTDEQVKPALGKVDIKNDGKTVSWGALHWQYLENLDKISPSETDIHLERKYFIEKQTDAGPVLTAVDAKHQPKTGDLLKVVVYLKAGRDFEYVQLKDMRPAGTEPVDVLSTYKYQDGLFYYQVTKDVATNFFISQLNKGNYVFEYRLRVAQPGNFSTGISTVQCMYAPEFNAHSEGARMVVR